MGISEHTWTHHVFRAVETRTAVIHTDVAWNSHVIDPYGRILVTEDVSDSTRQVLVGDVPLGSGRTLVNTLGDWMGWVSLAGLGFFWVFMEVEKKRQKKAQEMGDAAS